MIRARHALAAIAALGCAAMASSSPPPRQQAGGRPSPISVVDVIERTDREAILRSIRILGVVECREGSRRRRVLWFENIWPYGYVDSQPDLASDWSTVREFKELFHGGGCPDRPSTSYERGSSHTKQQLRGASTYTYAPLPSWLMIGDDRRTNNIAFPDPEDGFGRIGLAHCSGFLDKAWTDPELARMQQPVPAEADAFARCFKDGDPVRCFGQWGPQNGSYPRTGWMPDGSRRSRLLAMLYSAQLAREGPQGHRTPWQEGPPSTGRGHTYYRLKPRDTGPETGSGWIQLIYPDREEAMQIGSPEVFEGEMKAPPRMGAILYATFRRPAEPGAPCDSVKIMPPKKVSP